MSCTQAARAQQKYVKTTVERQSSFFKINAMIQYCNFDNVMETKEHSKNGANTKNLMNKRNLLKNVYFGFLLVSLIFSGCESRTKEVNKILEEYGFYETITGKSEDEINTELFNLLKERNFIIDKYILRKISEHELMIKELPELADMIIKMKCFGTAKKIISKDDPPHDKQLYLALWIIIKIDALLEKTPEAESVLELFYKGLENGRFANQVTYQFRFLTHNFLKLHEEDPNILELFYPEIISIYESKTNGSINNAIINSSMKLKNEIIKRNVYNDIKKSFPLSRVKTILADFKPSSPQKGGYIIVFDDTDPKLPKISETIKDDFSSGYGNETLFQVQNPNKTQVIIYETYSYSKQFYNYVKDGIMIGGKSDCTVYLRNTNVKVVNVITGKTIFDKTFKTPAEKGYITHGGAVILVDRYKREKFVKEIAELVKKN